MIEILVLIALGKRIGSILRRKGRKAGWYQALLVALWFGGEIIGGIFGGIITRGQGGLVIYLLALIGAVVGAVIAFSIANSASPSALGSEQADTQQPT